MTGVGALSCSRSRLSTTDSTCCGARTVTSCELAPGNTPSLGPAAYGPIKRAAWSALSRLNVNVRTATAGRPVAMGLALTVVSCARSTPGAATTAARTHRFISILIISLLVQPDDRDAGRRGAEHGGPGAGQWAHRYHRRRFARLGGDSNWRSDERGWLIRHRANRPSRRAPRTHRCRHRRRSS